MTAVPDPESRVPAEDPVDAAEPRTAAGRKLFTALVQGGFAREQLRDAIRAIEVEAAIRSGSPTDAALPEKLRALSEAATPGPWSVRHRASGSGVGDDESAGLGWEFGWPWGDPRSDEPAGPPEPMLRGVFSRYADAAFIVEAAAYVRSRAASGSPEPVLDVERLARAIRTALWPNWSDEQDRPGTFWHADAKKVAAEYAALTTLPSDTPGSEDREP